MAEVPQLIQVFKWIQEGYNKEANTVYGLDNKNKIKDLANEKFDFPVSLGTIVSGLKGIGFKSYPIRPKSCGSSPLAKLLASIECRLNEIEYRLKERNLW